VFSIRHPWFDYDRSSTIFTELVRLRSDSLGTLRVGSASPTLVSITTDLSTMSAELGSQSGTLGDLRVQLPPPTRDSIVIDLLRTRLLIRYSTKPREIQAFPSSQ